MVTRPGKPGPAGAERSGPRIRVFRLPGAARRDPAVDRCLAAAGGPLGDLARRWFGALRAVGDDVRETLHDGQPTACIGDAAFGYVDVFKRHVNVGFFLGAELPDPAGLLEGTGAFMRHVKLRPDRPVDEAALERLIQIAAEDLRARLGPADQGQ